MGETKIEWAHYTFNGWIGCTKVSAGCANCYAEREDGRRGWTPAGWGPGKDRKRTSEAYWRAPLTWNEKARKDGRRPRVFAFSLADWADEEVEDSWRDDLFGLIAYTPDLDWLLLTKRPENAQRYLRELHAGKRKIIDRLVYGPKQRGIAAALVVKMAVDKNWPNIWAGVSVEDQETAEERIPILLDTPAAVRWVSYEPSLGPLDMHPFIGESAPGGVDWIIAGGESGPKARGFSLTWAETLIEQCADAGVACFVKQLGEHHAKLNGLKDRKGGDWSEWPPHLKVREFPR